MINKNWQEPLQEEIKKPYIESLTNFLITEYATKTIYPKQTDIFNALNETPYEDVKVVILGQDPYHGPHQAHGLSFSVLPGTKIPPSLVNIFKEMQRDLDIDMPSTGCLIPWAKQGVLLLNTVLTVEAGKPHSHKNQGWETFTDSIIRKVNQKEDPVVFILWGKPAQQKKQMIDQGKHLVIEGPHPSPLSAYRGFFDSKPFSRTNDYLTSKGLTPINWNLPQTQMSLM